MAFIEVFYGFRIVPVGALVDMVVGRAVALFGPAGQRDDWPAPTTAPLDAMQAEVTRRYGVVFLDTEA